MNYVEKHVTTKYGEERVDWPAAVSVEMCNSLAEKLHILNDVNGNAKLEMNQGELNYSVFGPMKKAALLTRDVKKDEVFSQEMICFVRTAAVADISQLEIVNSFGKKFKHDMHEGDVLMHSAFA